MVARSMGRLRGRFTVPVITPGVQNEASGIWLTGGSRVPLPFGETVQIQANRSRTIAPEDP